MGVAAIAVGWAAAFSVYLAAPRRPANRLLAFVLVIESTCVGMARGIDAFHDSARVSLGLGAVIIFLQVLNPLAYLLFYSRLDSRLARFLRRPAVVASATLADLALLAYAFSHMGTLEEFSRTYFVAFRIWTAFGLLGLVVAVTAWREARGPQTRRQAKAYALAFGFRDLTWFLYVFWLYPGFSDLEPTHPFWGPFFAVFAPGITITFVGLLAYAILRHQLFDIDVRIKRGVGRTLALAAIAAAFFGVSEAIEASLPVDGLGPGIAAAAVVTLAFLPIQRAVTRGLQRLFPSDPARRKEEVYQAAFEEMGRDGRLTPAEQAQLAQLRARLGLAA